MSSTLPDPKAGFAGVALPNAGLPKLGRPKPPPLDGPSWSREVADINRGLEELKRRREMCCGALGAPYLVAQSAQTEDGLVSYFVSYKV